MLRSFSFPVVVGWLVCWLEFNVPFQHKYSYQRRFRVVVGWLVEGRRPSRLWLMYSQSVSLIQATWPIERRKPVHNRRKKRESPMLTKSCIKLFAQLDQLIWKLDLLLLHPFNGLFSRTIWLSRHQKGKPFWILLEQEIMGWRWHQLDHMQIICTSLQRDKPHQYFTTLQFFCRPDALPAAQPTASKH